MKGLAGIGQAIAVAIALAATACAPPDPPAGSAPSGTDREKATALASSPAAMMAASAKTELGRRIGTAPDAVVAGVRLTDVDRLRRFYARHGFAPVWTTRADQAAALTAVVLRSGEHGLAPEMFHADLLRVSESLPPLDRELVLSDALLAYADALARGAVPVERRQDDQTLTPGKIDTPAALDAAINSPDPAAALEALAPATPTYQLLREALRDLRTGRTGVGKSAAGIAAATNRWQTIEVNLERERWLPRRLPADRVWVNVADQRLTMYRDEQAALSMKVVVGQSGKGMQSPELQVPIDAIWFNPPWTIPDDIARNEILPLANKDPTYLARHNLVMLPNGTLQQKASPYSALGVLMFDMNNRFDVYLHDTPSKDLFLRDNRRISHGCIRVEDARQLAALVMRKPVDAIDQVIATGDTARTPVPKPVPVFVVYETAFADSDGQIQFRPDVYGRDADIWRALAPPARVVASR